MIETTPEELDLMAKLYIRLYHYFDTRRTSVTDDETCYSNIMTVLRELMVMNNLTKPTSYIERVECTTVRCSNCGETAYSFGARFPLVESCLNCSTESTDKPIIVKELKSVPVHNPVRWKFEQLSAPLQQRIWEVILDCGVDSWYTTFLTWRAEIDA